LFGVCLALWRQKSTPASSSAGEPGTDSAGAIGKEQFLAVLTTQPMHKTSRRLLLQLASSSTVQCGSVAAIVRGKAS
jgi:hypothetical protein